MPFTLPEVQKVVIASGKVNQKDLEQAILTSKHLEVPLEDVLIGRRLIDTDELGSLLATSKGISYINLTGVKLPKETLGLVPEEFAVTRHVVPFKAEGRTLYLAMEDPADLEAIEFVKKQSGYEVQPVYATKTSIQQALLGYKGTLQEEFSQLVEESVAKTSAAQAPLSELAKDVSIVKAVDTLIEFAIVQRASDIHIEPLPDEVVIRYRIDGVLHDVLELPLELHPALVARFKILTNMKLDETRVPQDGRMQFKSEEGKTVSLRVSVLPTVQGEKVVLRVLEETLRHFSLTSLGLDETQVKLVSQVITKPHGMILVTGPTGSGKTTTLYTILGLLNTTGVNISTVEDPVENRLRRVNQTQVNSQAGYTFANGLRSLLRQDPDIIMVGEIRDQETAKIAVNAAMTGHLVLSTLHTNDAPGAIPRMLDLGVEPFLLASTLEMVIAQRLVRKICPDCAVEQNQDKGWAEGLRQVIKDPKELELALAQLPPKHYIGQGGPECRFSGYKGRVGIYEMVPITDQLKELITSKATATKLKAVAMEQGMHTMLIDGLTKVKNRITTIDEVLRVSLE